MSDKFISKNGVVLNIDDEALTAFYKSRKELLARKELENRISALEARIKKIEKELYVKTTSID